MNRIWGLGLSVALAAASLVSPSASATPLRENPSQNAPSANGAAASGLAAAHFPRRVPGEVVVRYRSSIDPAARAELRRQVAAQAAESLALAGTEVLEVPNGSVDDAIAALESSPDVLFAEPNFYYRAAVTPNDPRFSQEWGLHNTGQSVMGSIGSTDADIDAPEAWELTTGSSDVVVAIVDSGVDQNHPDLRNNVWTNPGETGGGRESNGVDDDDNGMVDDWRGWDFVDGDNRPRDLVGHGTHVAGTVGASGNDGTGITGVAWDVSLMALRVLNDEGSGSTADVANAIAYATAKGADVINLSLEGPDFSLSVANAISAAPNTTVVVAAGNSNKNIDVASSYPCNYQLANIMCVAATDSNDSLAGYSNYGAVNVDLAAPGSRVVSAIPAFLRPLRETFSTDIAGRWIAGGTGTQWSRAVDELGGFVTDSAGTDYLSNSDTWLATADPVNLADQQNCRLTYAFSLDTETNGDFFDIEASSNDTAWTSVGGWTGSTGGDWLTGTHDLSAFDGGDLYVRFRLRSNLLVNRDGASVDSVEVRCLGTTYSGAEYSYFSGTSMAAPHVTGVAALILSAAPDATVAEVRNALLGGADPLSSLFGKSATGARLNAARALGLVLSGAAPDLPLPSLSPLPGGGGDPSPSASPSVSPSVSPSPSPSASVSPSPSPSDPPVAVDHTRTVRLRLKGHLRLRGRVVVPDGETICLASIKLRIKRNGRVVRTVTTGALGGFSVKLRDRKGRYVVKVPAFDITGGRCLRGASPIRRHRH